MEADTGQTSPSGTKGKIRRHQGRLARRSRGLIVTKNKEIANRLDQFLLSGFSLLVFALSVLLANPAPVRAQASLKGRVVGPTAEPVARAQIEIQSSLGTVLLATETTSGGVFRVASIQPGNYRLSSGAAGFFAAHYDITLRPRQTLLLTIELAPRNALGQHVEIRSSYAELNSGQTGASQLLTREALEAMSSPLVCDLPTLALNTFWGASLSHDNFIHVRGNELSMHAFVDGVGFLDNPQQEFGPGLRANDVPNCEHDHGLVPR